MFGLLRWGASNSTMVPEVWSYQYCMITGFQMGGGEKKKEMGDAFLSYSC